MDVLFLADGGLDGLPIVLLELGHDSRGEEMVELVRRLESSRQLVLGLPATVTLVHHLVDVGLAHPVREVEHELGATLEATADRDPEAAHVGPVLGDEGVEPGGEGDAVVLGEGLQLFLGAQRDVGDLLGHDILALSLHRRLRAAQHLLVGLQPLLPGFVSREPHREEFIDQFLELAHGIHPF